MEKEESKAMRARANELADKKPPPLIPVIRREDVRSTGGADTED